MIYWIWLATVLAALVLYLRQVYSRFSGHGVQGSKPLPLVGTIGRVMLKLEHFADNVEESYNSFPNERFVGTYQFLRPILLVRDLDLVKKIAVKDFEHFLDHQFFVDEKNDPFFGRNLISLRGQEWKDMRSTLSPAFTSSKMRHMLPFMVEVGNQMIHSIRDRIKTSGVNSIDMDAKDLSTRYANDVIASCAFGLKVNSLTDQENQFYEMGKVASTFKFRQVLVFLMSGSFPQLTKLLKISLFPEASNRFFKDLVLSTMQDREARNIIRPDMIHLLMEAKKGNLTRDEKAAQDVDAGFATVEESAVGKKEINRVWTDTDLIAQAVLFFIAGFETVSSAMSFLLYELAVNPDVQEKLHQEIKENDAKNGGKFDYTSIQQMTYMDMVVSEVLRLWSPVIALDRQCIKDYNIGRPNHKATEDYIVRKGEGIHLPVWAFHRNPDYFPNPDKFDPERFSEQNKHNIKPFTYMPFGLGPRNCIGSRFALCEVKVMTYQLIQALELAPCEKTPIPAKLCPNAAANIRIKGGHMLRFKMRN